MQRKLETLKEYIISLGRWIWFLVADLLGIIQDLLFDIPIIKNISLQVWVVLLFLFLIIANFHAFYKISQKRDELAKKLDDRSKLNAKLHHLASLRTIGVELRNIGMPLKSENKINRWIDIRKKWKELVIRAIESISPAQAEVFQTLDLVQMRSFGTNMPPKLEHHLNMLSDEIENLKELIAKLEPWFQNKD